MTLETVFSGFFTRAVQASFLIVAVIVLRFLLRRQPKNATCLLWVLVAVRLVCPFSLQSATSLLPAQSVDGANRLSSAAARVPVSAGAGAVWDAAQTAAPVQGATQAVQAATGVSWQALLAVLWLVGAVLLAAYAVFSWLRLRRAVAEAVLYRPGVLQCDAAAPFVLGVLRPRIYLPYGLSAENEPYVLAHERAHIARHDTLWKPLAFALLAAYWFSPLVWVGYLLFCRDIEQACDEAAVRSLSAAGRKAYSRALLDCSAAQKRRAYLICPVAFGESNIGGRVRRVLNYRRPAFWVTLAALAAAVTVAVLFLLEPKPQTGGFAPGDAVENQEIAGGITTLSDGSRAEVRLVMESGQVLSDANDSSSLLLRGDCVLQLWVSGAQRASMAVASEDMLFSAENIPDYVLQFADYNADGSPEFALGVLMGDVHGAYTIYTVSTGGFIPLTADCAVQADPAAQAQGGTDMAKTVFSPLFQTTETGFAAQWYDNSLDALRTCDWSWNGTAFALETADTAGDTGDIRPGTTVLTRMAEGEEEQLPATLFVGSGYSIYLTDGDFTRTQAMIPGVVDADAFTATANNAVVLWVQRLSGQTPEYVLAWQEDVGYHQTETEGDTVLVRENGSLGSKGATIATEYLFCGESDVWLVGYEYPYTSEYLEGWDSLLPVIVYSFAETAAEALPEDAETEAGQQGVPPLEIKSFPALGMTSEQGAQQSALARALWMAGANEAFASPASWSRALLSAYLYERAPAVFSLDAAPVTLTAGQAMKILRQDFDLEERPANVTDTVALAPREGWYWDAGGIYYVDVEALNEPNTVQMTAVILDDAGRGETMRYSFARSYKGNMICTGGQKAADPTQIEDFSDYKVTGRGTGIVTFSYQDHKGGDAAFSIQVPEALSNAGGVDLKTWMGKGGDMQVSAFVNSSGPRNTLYIDAVQNEAGLTAKQLAEAQDEAQTRPHYVYETVLDGYPAWCATQDETRTSMSGNYYVVKGNAYYHVEIFDEQNGLTELLQTMMTSIRLG